MDFNKFMDILGATEEYQIQPRLIDMILSDRKESFFDELIENGFCIKKDEIREIFENELANRKTLKQDYTPDCLCSLVSNLCETRQDEILDVCCGVGSLSLKNISESTHFFMEEISDVSISMALLNMAIRNANADIYKKDVLTKEVFEHYSLTKGEKYSNIKKIDLEPQSAKYKCIISNPPYSLKWDALNDERFWNYGVAPKSKADFAFVLDILYRLNEDGKAFIILPHGVLFRGAQEGAIRKALIHDNVIDAIIGLPEKLFTNTNIPTIILCLKKSRKDNDVLFIDASKQFIKQGNHNIMNENHIQKIVDAYSIRKEIEKFSHRASFKEIEDNDFNLNIPRYVDTYEQAEPVDLKETIDNIVKMEDEIHEIDMDLAKMFGELRGDEVYESEKLKIIEHLNNRYVHDLSNALNRIYKYMDSKKELSNHNKMNLLDLVDIERSKKNKQYPRGSILVQLSATRGQMEYLEEKSLVEQKYGVMTVKDNCINSKYLYYMISINMENFLNVYQTGLNITTDAFRFMKLEIHTDKNVQEEIVKMFDKLEMIEKTYFEEIEKWKDIKTYHLDNMFI